MALAYQVQISKQTYMGFVVYSRTDHWEGHKHLFRFHFCSSTSLESEMSVQWVQDWSVLDLSGFCSHMQRHRKYCCNKGTHMVDCVRWSLELGLHQTKQVYVWTEICHDNYGRQYRIKLLQWQDSDILFRDISTSDHSFFTSGDSRRH
jgi:hypothetical protein